MKSQIKCGQLLSSLFLGWALFWAMAQGASALPSQTPVNSTDPPDPFSPLQPKLIVASSGRVPLDGQIRIRVLGQASKSYVLESSLNLRDWTPLATNQASIEGFFDFVDPAAGQSTPRFYRAILLAADAVPLVTDFFRGNRILVKPKPGVNLSPLHALLGAQVLRAFSAIGDLQVLRIPAGRSVSEIILEYRQSTLVEYAEPDYLVRVSRTPNDPRFNDGTLWGLHNTGQMSGANDADIDALEAWDLQTAAGDIVVAVIDTGVRYTHEDLAANLWVNPGESGGTLIALNKSVNRLDDDGNGYADDVHGINAILGTGNPLDDHGHGTHVSGTIGAVGDNGLGGVGVAWRARIMACKFLDARGEGAISDAITCIDYARRHGAKIINAAWGSPTFQSAGLRDAIDSARRAGILFVAACGNDGRDNDLNPLFPASYALDNVVAVAATERTDRLAAFSNFGAATVDLAAPGHEIFSAWNGSDSAYQFLSGTSMASAHVSGAGALLWSRFPGETYGQIRDRLFSSVDPLPTLAGKSVTGGRLNLSKALAGIRSSTGPVADFTVSPDSGPVPLNVQFTDKSVGDIAARDWDFGDGTAHSTEPNPAHGYYATGNFVATLTVTGADGSLSRKSRTISVNSTLTNYQIQPAAFNWIDPSALPALTLGDDGVSAPQTVPFDFVFYGKTFRQFYVAANGLIGFFGEGLSTAANTDLPNATLPNAILAPYWADLNPAQGGQIRVGTVGTAPGRRTVISWVDVPVKSGALFPSRFTFQAALSEGSNQILFQYRQVEPNRLLGERQTGTVGLENETGTVAAKHTYRENPSALANNQALLFVPQIPAAPGGPCADDAASVHFPDLITLRPTEITIVMENNRKLLRFSNTAANIGHGPVEVFPKNNPSGTTDAFQRFYTHDANCAWSPADTKFVGTFAFHSEHDHWHFENFARYEMHNVAANGSVGETVLANSGKVSFCLGDTILVDARLKHAAPQTYSQCDQSHPQGISVGWGDIYQWYLPGQSLDITSLSNGEYWLVSTADPSNLLNEGGGVAETNNATALKLRIQGTGVTVIQ